MIVVILEFHQAVISQLVICANHCHSSESVCESSIEDERRAQLVIEISFRRISAAIVAPVAIVNIGGVLPLLVNIEQGRGLNGGTQTEPSARPGYETELPINPGCIHRIRIASPIVIEINRVIVAVIVGQNNREIRWTLRIFLEIFVIVIIYGRDSKICSKVEYVRDVEADVKHYVILAACHLTPVGLIQRPSDVHVIYSVPVFVVFVCRGEDLSSSNIAINVSRII